MLKAYREPKLLQRSQMLTRLSHYIPMQRFILTVCLLCACFACRVGAADAIAIINVNVIPMSSETVLPGRTVIVADGVITQIGNVKEVPIAEGIDVVDGTDRYLVPGLAEMHGHVPSAGSATLQRVLNLYVANGITLVRGMLGQASHLQLREQIASGEVLGPRLVTSGPSFNGRSVSSPGQASRMIEDQFEAGYDFAKIHPGPSREEFDAIAEVANRLNFPFAGHVPEDVGVSRALAAGIATIDHLDGYMQALLNPHDDPSGGYDGFFGLFIAGQADMAKIPVVVTETQRAGTWNVPTQSLFEHVVSPLDPVEMSNWPEMRYMPVETVDAWVDYKTKLLGDPGYSETLANRAIDIRRKLIKSLHDAGAGLLLGSDAPQIFNVPGFSIHRELEFLVQAGLTPYEALRTGTVNPAVFFGFEQESGTIETGKAANLVLLDANPLNDISATRRVHGVMLRGQWIGNPEIREMLAALKRRDVATQDN